MYDWCLHALAAAHLGCFIITPVVNWFSRNNRLLIADLPPTVVCLCWAWRLLYNAFSASGATGERSSVVRESEFKSEDPGFDPLERQGEKPFFCPSELTLVQTCLCLYRPPFVCVTCTQICAHVKDPISICHKRGLTVGVFKHENIAHRKEKKSWVALYYGCSLSPGKAAQIPMHCIGTTKLLNQI